MEVHPCPVATAPAADYDLEGLADSGQIVALGRLRALTVDASSDAAVKVAQAQIEQSEAGINMAEASQNRFEADLEQAKAKRTQAERDWDRARRLGPSGAIDPPFIAPNP